MLGFSLTERNQSLSVECAQMVCGLCLGKSEDRKHELRLFRKKSSCWWHVQLRGRCTMCTVRWSLKERLPVEILTKIWMTKNIVTSFKNLHICLVYLWWGTSGLKLWQIAVHGSLLQERNQPMDGHSIPLIILLCTLMTMDGSDIFFQWYRSLIFCALYFFFSGLNQSWWSYNWFSQR